MLTRILLLCGCFAFNASAAVLTLDSNLELQALNGKKVDYEGVPVTLNDGKNQIVVRVYGNFPKGSNEELFVSRPYVVSFDTNQDVRLSLPAKTNDYRKVTTAFRQQQLEWELKAGSTSKEYTSDPLPGKGLAPFSNIEQSIAEFNKANGIAIASTGVEDFGQTVVVVATASGNVNAAVEGNIASDPLTQLKVWYSRASKSERKSFRKWIVDIE